MLDAVEYYQTHADKLVSSEEDKNRFISDIQIIEKEINQILHTSILVTNN